MSATKLIPVGLLLLVMVLFPLLPAVAAPGDVVLPDLTVSVDAPEMLATGQREEVTVQATGGPATGLDGGDYSFEAWLTGTNLSGTTDPIISRPATDTNTGGIFTFDLVMPIEAQDLTLHLKVTSSDGGDDEVEVDIEWFLEAVEPIELSMAITNPGSVTAEDVNIEFYIDDEKVGEDTIPTIAAGGSATARFQYLEPDVEIGEHTYCAKVASNQTLFIDGSNSSGAPCRSFWIEETSGSAYWIATFVVLFLGVILVAWYMFKI